MRKPPSEEFRHRLSFSQKEAETVQASYVERVNRLHREGRDDEITDFDLEISGLPPKREAVIRINSPVHVAAVLEEFHRRTPQAVKKIEKKNRQVDHRNRTLPERLRLGRTAKNIADLIRSEASAVAKFQEELETITPDTFAQEQS